MDELQPLSYREVLDLYQANADNPRIKRMGLPGFANWLNKTTKTDLFSAGATDNWIKRSSVALDKALEVTRVPQALGGAFAAISPSRFQEQARGLGEDLPRMFLEGIPVAAAGAAIAASAPVAAAVTIPLAIAATGSAFAHGYTDSGSPLVGLVTAATNAAMPSAGKLGARFLTGPISKRLGMRGAEHAIDLLGHSLGQATLLEAGNLVTSVGTGQRYNPFTAENLFQQLGPQIVFAPFNIFSAMRGPRKGVPTVGEELRIRDVAKQEAATKAMEFAKAAEQKKFVTQRQEDVARLEPPGSDTGFIDEGDAWQAYADQVMLAQMKEKGFREETVFGRPAVPVKAKETPTEVPLATEAKGKTPVSPVGALVAGEGKKQRATPDTSTPETALAAATKILAEHEVKVDAEATVEAAQVANAVADHLGEPRPFNDITLGKVVAEHERTKPAAVVGSAVGGTVENKLNELAGVLGQADAEKERLALPAPTQDEVMAVREGERAALATIAQLPTQVKDFISRVIAKVSQEHASEQFSEFSDARMAQAALSWFRQNSDKVTEAAVAHTLVRPKAEGEHNLVPPRMEFKNPEVGGNLQAQLEGVLTTARHRGEAVEVARRTERGEVVTGVPEAKPRSPTGPEYEAGVTKVDLPSEPPPPGMSVFGEIAHHGEEAQTRRTLKTMLAELITSKPITTQETGRDAVYTARLNAVAQDLARSSYASQDRRHTLGFGVEISDETRAVFAGVKDATIQTFITKNIGELRKAMEHRARTMGISFSAKGHPDVLSFFRAMTPGSPAPKGLPLAVRTFFLREFLARGHSPEIAAQFADVAMRVSAQFAEIDGAYIARLTDISSRNIILGMSEVVKANPNLRAISIRMAELLSDTPQEFNRFAKGLVLGHEAFEQFYRLSGTSLVSDERRMLTERLMSAASQADSELRKGVMQAALECVVPPKLLNDPRIKGFLNDFFVLTSEDPKEFVANYFGLLALGAAHPSGVKGVSRKLFSELTYSDKAYSDFASAAFNDLRDLAGALLDLAVANGMQKEPAARLISALHDSYTQLARTRVEVEEAVGALERLAASDPMFAPEVIDRIIFGDNVVFDTTGLAWLAGQSGVDREFSRSFLGRAGVLKETEPFIGKRPNWYEEHLMIPAQLRELYPELAHVTALVLDFRGEATKRIQSGMAPFGVVNKIGQVVFDKDAPLVRVRSSEKMTNAASEILLEENWQKKRLTPEEVGKLSLFSTLSPDEQSVVSQFIEQGHQANKKTLDGYLEGQKSILGNTLAVTMLASGLRGTEAIKQGQGLQAALFGHVRETDPALRAQADAAANAILRGFDPKTQVALAETFVRLYKEYSAMEKNLLSQAEYYSPEVRLGNWWLRFEKDGQRAFYMFKTEAELAAKLQAIKADPTVTPDSVKAGKKSTSRAEVNMLYGDILNVVKRFEDAAFDDAIKVLAATNAEAAKTMEELYSPVEATFREVVARGYGRHFGEQREMVLGREEINMPQGIVAYIEGVGMGLAKKITKQRAAILLGDKDLTSNPELLRVARKYVTTVVDPPAREWSKFKNIAFHYFLGGNLSSLVVEGFQPVFSLAPELVRRGHGFFGSYKLIGRAEAAASKLLFTGKSGLPEHWRVADAVKQAIADQVFDFGVLQEMEGLDTDTNILNLRRVQAHLDPMRPQDLLLKPLYWYGHLTRSAYRLASSHNTKVGFLAGFIEAMEQGKSFDEAYDLGKRMSRATMYGGGAASRPIGLFAKSGKFYGAVGALYTLRHYSVSMFSEMWRFYKEGFGNLPIAPEERAMARKAFMTMLGTQVFMSGALGLPLAGGAAAVVEQLFPGVPVKQKIHEWLDKLSGDEDETNQWLSDVAVRGITSGLLPFDLSARFGLGDAFGIDPQHGVTAKTFFGAAGSLVERWVKGTAMMTSGDTGNAVKQLLPNWAGTLAKLYRDDFKIRDNQGNLIYNPSQGEVLGAMVGFRPRQLSYFREKQAYAAKLDEVAKADLGRFHRSLAEMLLSGNIQGVRDSLLSRGQQDEFYDVKAGVISVVEAAQRRLYPTDSFRTGSRSTVRSKEELLGAYPRQAQPTEVERTLQKAQMVTRVLPTAAPALKPELRQAAMIDYLMRLNPAWSRQHAAIALQLLSGRGEQHRASIGLRPGISQLFQSAPGAR